MKLVRLLKLELTNYRNIDHQVLVFDGANAKIVGENRIGKTNTLEAIYFLLTNYLLDGGSDIANLKPLNDTKKVVSVEGTFEVFDTDTQHIPPKEIKIAKKYGENWVKKRGSDQVVLDGHYEEYYVNGIKQSKERDFHELLGEHFGVRNDEKGEIDPIQMLINPLYLGNLGDSKDWTKLRTYIVKLIGDVKDEEIFEKAPTTLVIKSDLENALGKTEMLKKSYSNDIDTINGQLLGYDSQIDLLEKTDCPSEDDVNRSKLKIEEINTEISNIKSGSTKDVVVEQLEQEIYQIDRQIVELSKKDYDAYLSSKNNNKLNELQTKESGIRQVIDQLVSDIGSCKVSITRCETSIDYNTKRRQEMVDEYKKVVSEIENVDKMVVSICPTCQRPLEKEDVEKSKNIMLENLTSRKNSVVASGNAIKDELAKAQNELNGFQSKKAELEQKLDKVRKDLDDVVSQIAVAKGNEQPYTPCKELADLNTKKNAKVIELNDRKAKASSNATSQYELISKLELDKSTAQKVIDDKNYYDRQMVLLGNVKELRKTVSNKLIQVEQKKEALNTYIYTRLKLLDEHIAKIFGNIKFQLIKENLNGGFDPICKPYIYDIEKQESTDVLWKSGSKSEKIITGIAIVEAIRNQLGLTSLPFLFDEGGEISSETLRTKFITKSQIICVKVEDNVQQPVVVKF